MAAGKLSNRQKMINMMYLVLMAMLALNVSKEVLLAFGNINDSINSTTKQLVYSSDFIYNDLKSKNQNNPEKYSVIYERATEVKIESNKVVALLDDITKEFENRAGERDEDGNLPWGDMDSKAGDEILFPGGDPKRGRGAELENAVSDYRELLLTMTKNPAVKQQIETSLNTDPIITPDGAKIPWVKQRFEHYPLAAAMTFISQIKADVRNAQSSVMQKVADEALGEQITVNKMTALPIASSTTVMKGAKFEAKLMLAAYDSTLEPDMYLWKVDANGNRLDNSEKKLSLKGGAGIVEIPTSSTGEFSWGGVIRVKSEDGSEPKEYPFISRYNVNEPAVVISADKMNVLYRGVSNPISVSVPGVPANKLKVTGPGLRQKSAGKYIANVTTVRGREANIVVTATMADGSTKTFPAQKYRIKDIPMPMGAIGGKPEIKLPVTNLTKLPIEARLPNFEFDLKLKVVSFNLKIPGKPTFKVRGNKTDRRVNDALKRVPIGSEITIRDIKVQIPGNASYKIARVSPIVVTITGR
ncbi:MAG: gliding motility protein GldM [Bacteroidota bacterium]